MRAPAHRGTAAEGTCRFLQRKQLRLSGHRQRGERRAGVDAARVELREDVRECRRRSLGMADLGRQAREQLALAQLRLARLERVEMLIHCVFP